MKYRIKDWGVIARRSDDGVNNEINSEKELDGIIEPNGREG